MPGTYNMMKLRTDFNVIFLFQRVPGPGMYESTFQSPPTKTIRKMGRVHGLFFSCSFQP